MGVVWRRPARSDGALLPHAAYTALKRRCSGIRRGLSAWPLPRMVLLLAPACVASPGSCSENNGALLQRSAPPAGPALGAEEGGAEKHFFS